MHASTFLTILATALAASALQVTAPNANQGWVSTGSNTLSWQRVSTDATNFTVYLTNTDRSVLPVNNQLLAAFVDSTNAASVSIEAPSGGFNVGSHYRVNLVKSQDDPTTIYAQSDEFDITAGSSSATGSTASSGSASSGASTTGSPTVSNSATPSGTSGSNAASSSDLNPSSTANAAGSHKTEFGLLGALLLLGGALA